MAAGGGGAIATRPNVHFVLCTEDHNAAFSPVIMGIFIDGIADRANVVVSRIRSMTDLVIALSKGDKEADYLVLGGHGSAHHLRFSRDAVIEDAEIIRTHLSRRSIKIVLLSCLTGKKGCDSLAQRIAVLGIDVLAPRGKAFLHNTKPNPLFGHKAGAFPINFSEGELYTPDGLSKSCTGYEDVRVEDVDLLRDGMDETHVAYRAFRLMKMGKSSPAIALLSSLHEIDQKYTENKIADILILLMERGETEFVECLVTVLKRLGNETPIHRVLSRLDSAEKASEWEALRTYKDAITVSA